MKLFTEEDLLYELPPDQKEIHAPDGGWKEHTVYLVWVAYKQSNPIHKALLIIGFLNGGNGDEGLPGGYSEFHSNTYDSAISFHDAYFLKPIQELCVLK